MSALSKHTGVPCMVLGISVLMAKNVSKQPQPSTDSLLCCRNVVRKLSFEGLGVGASPSSAPPATCRALPASFPGIARPAKPKACEGKGEVPLHQHSGSLQAANSPPLLPSCPAASSLPSLPATSQTQRPPPALSSLPPSTPGVEALLGQVSPFW